MGVWADRVGRPCEANVLSEQRRALVGELSRLEPRGSGLGRVDQLARAGFWSQRADDQHVQQSVGVLRCGRHGHGQVFELREEPLGVFEHDQALRAVPQRLAAAETNIRQQGEEGSPRVPPSPAIARTMSPDGCPNQGETSARAASLMRPARLACSRAYLAALWVSRPGWPASSSKLQVVRTQVDPQQPALVCATGGIQHLVDEG